MQPGTLLGSDVQAFTSYVLVNGVTRPVLSWSVDRDLTSDLPDGMVGGTGIAQASGVVEWADSDDVTDGSKNPWNPNTGWIPVEGDTVEIWAGDDSTTWLQFVGVIDSSSGSINGGLSSKIIDRIDDLSVRANLPSLVDVMPPVSASGPFRRFRLSPKWVVAQVLRRAGFYATPPREAHTTVDVTGYAGMWPLIGDMLTCARASNPDVSPLWPNDTHVADVSATYNPSGPRAGNKTLQLTMDVAAGHNGVATLQVQYGSANIALRATPTTVAVVSGGTVVCSVPRSGAVTAKMIFKNGAATVRTSAGQQASGTISWTATGLMTEVTISADANSLVNGFIVSHPEESWHEFAGLDWSPTANIVSGAMHGTLAALRNSREQSVREVLDEIAGALLWPYWIDEAGVMQMVASDVLRGRASSQTLTTLDDVRELDWERDLLGVRKEIVASFERVTINRRRDYSLPVWEPGESVVLKSGEEHASIIESNSEEWLMVDTDLKTMEDSALLNQGIGTWVGGVYTDGANEEWTNYPGAGQQINVRIEQINNGSWRIVHQALTLDAGKQIELRSKRGDTIVTTVLWPYWWDKNLPIVRAKGTFDTNTVERPAVTAGSFGPVLDHSCGLWATGGTPGEETTVVDLIASFIAGQATSPEPRIAGLTVGYDPRIQLGDVLTISSPNLLGVHLHCLVRSVNTTASSSGFGMQLGVSVISVTRTQATYADFAQAWGDVANYEAFAALWGASATYQDFNNDPLRTN